MTQAVLTLNAGSSSVKFALFNPTSPVKLILKGQVEGIGSDARLKAKRADGTIAAEHDLAESVIKNPSDALKEITSLVDDL